LAAPADTFPSGGRLAAELLVGLGGGVEGLGLEAGAQHIDAVRVSPARTPLAANAQPVPAMLGKFRLVSKSLLAVEFAMIATANNYWRR
jgi:hypothetical protein